MTWFDAPEPSPLYPLRRPHRKRPPRPRLWFTGVVEARLRKPPLAPLLLLPGEGSSLEESIDEMEVWLAPDEVLASQPELPRLCRGGSMAGPMSPTCIPLRLLLLLFLLLLLLTSFKPAMLPLSASAVELLPGWAFRKPGRKRI